VKPGEDEGAVVEEAPAHGASRDEAGLVHTRGGDVVTTTICMQCEGLKAEKEALLKAVREYQAPIDAARALEADVTRLTRERDEARAEVDRLREKHAEGAAEESIDDMVALCRRPTTDTLFRAVSEGGTVYVFSHEQVEALARDKGTLASDVERLTGDLHFAQAALASTRTAADGLAGAVRAAVATLTAIHRGSAKGRRAALASVRDDLLAALSTYEGGAGATTDEGADLVDGLPLAEAARLRGVVEAARAHREAWRFSGAPTVQDPRVVVDTRRALFAALDSLSTDGGPREG
jgi:hypothetical protein